MNIITIQVKGFTIYCENDQHEMYDFFVARDYFRMNKTEALELIPETHKLLDVKRDKKNYQVRYDDLIEISNNIYK